MLRFLDLFFSILGLLVLLPVFVLISLILLFDSGGGIFFVQSRVGKDNKDFRMIKFRTMRRDAERSGSLTVGNRDPRITPAGRILRKTKLDELPQLINVLKGEMSVVGPRPEIRKYVDLYTEEQRKVLSVRPGITDYASIQYFNENELLAGTEDPEKLYLEKIMPEKLEMNRKFIERPTAGQYFRILLETIRAVFR